MLWKPFVRPCAQCRTEIIAPEWSEFLSAGRVRNVWTCDACGYEFEDTVYFSAPELQTGPREPEPLLRVATLAA
jgi:hypothetical protein